ncbi:MULTISPECIES: hypothetical protein [Pseudomonas]|uniref:hypothetical protein n=1 Tax=Pseudomonas TaxID=286 RepID=UPI000B31AC1D|nr:MULTISPECIES: hypothetical protein [Pseudomonas]
MLVERVDLGNGGSFGVVLTPLKGTSFESDWAANTDLVLVSLLHPVGKSCTYGKGMGHYRLIDKMNLSESDAIGLSKWLDAQL